MGSIAMVTLSEKMKDWLTKNYKKWRYGVQFRKKFGVEEFNKWENIRNFFNKNKEVKKRG